MSLAKVRANFAVDAAGFSDPQIAGFDFHFGTLDNEQTPLTKYYENLL